MKIVFDTMVYILSFIVKNSIEFGTTLTDLSIFKLQGSFKLHTHNWFFISACFLFSSIFTPTCKLHTIKIGTRTGSKSKIFFV